MSSVFEITTAFALLLTLIYYYFQRNFDYWKKKNIPHVKPLLVFGNYAENILQLKTFGDVSRKICQKMPKESVIGAFYGTKPVLIALDPEIIKLITTKDFFYFNGREASDYSDKEVTTRNLFFGHGNTWKVLRQNLTPLFSSAKMKNMFHLILKCSKTLEHLLDRELKKSKVIDVKSLMARYTMDCICSCAFGIESNVMTEEDVAKNPFRQVADVFFEASRLRYALIKWRAIWPGIFYGFGLKIFPNMMVDFFSNVLFRVIKERKGTPSARQDFVDLMLVLKNKKYISGDSLTNPRESSGEKMTLEVDDELLVSQCTVFFGAGFETSASTLSMTLYELAKDKKSQMRAQIEVDAYLKARNGLVDYDCMSEMPYLEQCVNETMRLYPVLDVITREVRDTYRLPNGAQLDKGTHVHLPVTFLHRNPEHFSNPDSFQPERFSAEERKKIKPYTYMPFGEGGRICIGQRFARMQMMPALVVILKRYHVELADGMPPQVELEPKTIVMQTKQPIRLSFVKRDI